MKKLAFFALVLVLNAVPSRAQSVDASVSYSYFRLGNSGFGPPTNLNGVSGSIAYYPIRFLGLVGDFGAYHGSQIPLGGPGAGPGPSTVSLNTYTYLFGPRVMLRNPTRVKPFAQGLVGASHVTSNGVSSSQFAFSFGGGADIGILPHLSLRPQIDYVGLSTVFSQANCVRVSVGVAIHF